MKAGKCTCVGFGVKSSFVGLLEAEEGTGGWVGLESILAGSLEGVQTGG